MTTGEPGEDPAWQRADDLLAVAVREVGREALSRPTVVRNLCADLLPGDPLVTQLLIGAAEFDVAGRLRRQLDQGVDITGAVASVTTSFGAHSFAPYDYRRWVVEHTALVLGYGSAGSTGASTPVVGYVGVSGPGRVEPDPVAVAPTWGVAQQPFAAAPSGRPRPEEGATPTRWPMRNRLLIAVTGIGIVAVGAVIAASVLVGGKGSRTPASTVPVPARPTTVPSTTVPARPTTVPATTVPATTVPATTAPPGPTGESRTSSNSQLAASYGGTATNTTAGVTARLTFADVSETRDGSIQGQVLLGPPLVPSLAPFTGTVNGTVVTASVAYTASICVRNGCKAVFVGTVNSAGALSGTYVNSNGGGGMEYGTWEATPD